MAVEACHVIFGTYGFWLPNDPRGSWSDFVGAWELFLLGGKATKTDTRRSVAGVKHDREARTAVKMSLKYPEVRFAGIQAKHVGMAFGETAKHLECQILACSIMPQHVHLVLKRSKHYAETIVKNLKAAATTELVGNKLHPLAKFHLPGTTPPKMWAKGCWKVFLSECDEIVRAIRYVENNPLKDGLPAQRWSFVSKFV